MRRGKYLTLPWVYDFLGADRTVQRTSEVGYILWGDRDPSQSTAAKWALTHRINLKSTEAFIYVPAFTYQRLLNWNSWEKWINLRGVSGRGWGWTWPKFMSEITQDLVRRLWKVCQCHKAPIFQIYTGTWHWAQRFNTMPGTCWGHFAILCLTSVSLCLASLLLLPSWPFNTQPLFLFQLFPHSLMSHWQVLSCRVGNHVRKRLSEGRHI